MSLLSWIGVARLVRGGYVQALLGGNAAAGAWADETPAASGAVSPA